MVLKMKSKEIAKQIGERSKEISSLIADISIPIKKIVPRILEMFKEQQCGQEPYAMLVRNSLDAGKNGNTVDISKWDNTFSRLEEILDIVDKKGSYFSKVIFNESMGHRYVDYWLKTNDPKYEVKMLKCYKISYEIACIVNLTKNIDSTMFWTAIAYHRKGDFITAKKYYKIVADRKGERFVSRKFREKIVWSIIYARPDIELFPIKNVTDIFAKGNKKLRDIYHNTKNTVYFIKL